MNGREDIWTASMEDVTTEPVADTDFRETEPAFSPDGRWLALERPTPLATSTEVRVVFSHHSYTILRRFDVSPHGERFVMTNYRDPTSRLHLVTQWFAELCEIAPRH